MSEALPYESTYDVKSDVTATALLAQFSSNINIH